MKKFSAVASTIGVITLGAIAIPSGARASECEADPSSIAAHIFDMSDSNADGFLTPTEFADSGLERYGIPFDEYDANGDGEASADEYLDLFDIHHPPQGVI